MSNEELNDKQKEARKLIERWKGFSSDYLDFDAGYQDALKKAEKLWQEGLDEKKASRTEDIP